MKKQRTKELNPDLEHRIFSSVRDQSETAYFIFDLLSESLVSLNPACEKILGKSRYELFNYNSLPEIIHVEDKHHVIHSLKEVIRESKPKSFQFRISFLKRIKWLVAKVYIVKNESNEKNWLVGFIDEITPIKKFEELLYNINSKKNSILEILAHDLTRPLNTIQLLSSILKKELDGEKFDEVKKYFNIIDDTCTNSIDLITQLVNDELLLSTKVDLVKERIDIVEKINNLVEVYKWSQEEIYKTFNVISSQEKIFIMADEVKLLQAINNLIANAIKFTKDFGHIHIKIYKRDSNLQIIVKDDGIGIPANLQLFLFDKFTRAARVGLKGEKTVGLGMSITKTIVELHGGRIWFESEENKGSTFYISIPSTE